MTTTLHSSKLLAALVLLLVAGFTSTSRAAPDPFRIETKPPTAGYITASGEPIPELFLESTMLRSLSGYMGELTARDYVGLRRGLGKLHPEPEAGSIFAFVHMSRKGSDEVIVEFATYPDGSFSVRSQGESSVVRTIDAEALDSRVELPASDPQLPEMNTETDRRFLLDQPYDESPITLDRKTRQSRIHANYTKLTRVLAKETMQVRLPSGYNPEEPAGILIWISPSPSGQIPRIFEAVCDELGLICVGVDNNGNTRPLTDRLQNHLDSIETLAARYRIDRQRVYLTGMSGGGRCSGILQCCFPEIFAGAVPIVGLDTYHNAPTGQRSKYWPARLGKPSRRWFTLLKERRFAGITGTADFNEPEMIIRKDLMTKDGLNIRLDVIEGMGHTMPTSEQFADALKWVDEPRRETIEKNLARAYELLGAFNEQYPDPNPDDPEQLELLIDITAASPWSDPAWQAAEILGFERLE